MKAVVETTTNTRDQQHPVHEHIPICIRVHTRTEETVPESESYPQKQASATTLHISYAPTTPSDPKRLEFATVTRDEKSKTSMYEIKSRLRRPESIRSHYLNPSPDEQNDGISGKHRHGLTSLSSSKRSIHGLQTKQRRLESGQSCQNSTKNFNISQISISNECIMRMGGEISNLIGATPVRTYSPRP